MVMSNRNAGGSKGGSSKRGSDNSNQMGFDVEQQVILRLPPSAASRLAGEIEAGHSMKDRLTFDFAHDMRHVKVRYGAKTYPGKLVDLPCIIESLKTTDKKVFYKTGDICQMLVCREEDEEEEEKRRQAETELSPRKKEKLAERQFVYNHGITPPLKNVRKKRFRKTMKKKFLDMPEIEKEVKRLLRVDLEAREVKWEVVFEDEQQQQQPSQQPQPAQSSVPPAREEAGDGDDSRPGREAVSAAKTSEIFGYLSSDEEEEENAGAGAHGAAMDGEEAEEAGGSILERACRMTLTEEDLRPFAAVADCSGSLMAPFEEGLASGPGYPDPDTEARLQDRIAELTGEIERLKAFINVRESQLPSLENEKFRERLQQDIDSYSEQLSERRREFERLSGRLEAIGAGRAT